MGELYNYSVVSAPVIYELLYTVINYGHLKEPVKLSEKEKDAGGSASLSAIPVSVGEAPHRFCLFVYLFVCLFVCLFFCFLFFLFVYLSLCLRQYHYSHLIYLCDIMGHQDFSVKRNKIIF